MVRNIALLAGSSHPDLAAHICTHLGLPNSRVLLSKFAVGETRVEIGESVREKDVFIIQTGGGQVNDHLMELLIMISACKTASAKRVVAVLPLFPYSRQSDIPYNKIGAPLSRLPARTGGPEDKYTFDTHPSTPLPMDMSSSHTSSGNGGNGGGNGHDLLHKSLHNLSLQNGDGGHNGPRLRTRTGTMDSTQSDDSAESMGGYFNRDTHGKTDDKDYPHMSESMVSIAPSITSTTTNNPPPEFRPQPGYKQWVAQAGTLVAKLLQGAGADHVITMDLHDPQYQGFFDVPVDNLYAMPILRKHIQRRILPHHGGPDGCVVVSPDAGGAKRATAIADSLSVDFALIHKERRQSKHHDRQNNNLLLVGNVAGRCAILIDDIADTSNTITQAAKLLKREKATYVIALITHGVFSGDAIDRINHSDLDAVITTNSLPQAQHEAACPKLQVLSIGSVFAEAIRRVHHGESISKLFQME